ncbi:NUDIX hydrolase [Pseudolysinimonas kribbensis]|uniref:NUDIX hydrolase n=1 Tax=Pseudolysinimonas kribbensis TaxID=433641 RepID=A0ABQ6K0Z1_9MICO|nr:NUDIX hydrolase [Pseudolysinimonas kribbensis]GMA93607.1 NUDIX hydrolase [Pseudolysinimonas kribbensis]
MTQRSEPRPAATVLLLRDDPLRVLLVQRPTSGAFPSVLAFPGGSIDAGDGDPDDDTDARARAAAVRETREETGIALPGPAALVAWSRWITPAAEPRRFDTHFFAVRAPEGAEPAVDGIELVAARWAEPAEALRRREAGDWPIIAPTAFNLARLALSSRVDEVLAAARAQSPVIVEPDLSDGMVRIRHDAGYPVTELSLR